MSGERSRRCLLPVVTLAATAVLLLLVDPLLAGAPWWRAEAAFLRPALLPALLAWLVLCAGALTAVAMRPTRGASTLAATAVLGGALLPAVVGSVLLGSVFPASSPLWVSVVLGAAAATWSVLSVSRRAWQGARGGTSEVTETAPNLNAS